MTSSPPAGPFAIRLLHEIEELRACEAIAKLVWQVGDREVVPASHLRALQHAGGMVAGAFSGGTPVAFVVGFLARHEPSAELGLHSHLLAVLPEHRKVGVGRALKWFQRRWCLERGLPWITWTFDPLQAQNARMNLEHLGAVGEAYLPDFYGALGGVLFGSLATDRIAARWTLDAPEVLRLAGGAPPEREADPGARALTEDAGGRPVVHLEALEDEARSVRVAAPPSFPQLLREDPERAAAWRSAMRAVMGEAFGRGFRAVRFVDGCYLLARPMESRS